MHANDEEKILRKKTNSIAIDEIDTHQGNWTAMMNKQFDDLVNLLILPKRIGTQAPNNLRLRSSDIVKNLAEA